MALKLPPPSKGTSSLLGVGSQTKRGGVSSFQAGAHGLTVTGGADVNEMLETWGAMAVYVTSFVSSAVAHSVFNDSQNRVPYDTGELYESGYHESMSGIADSLPLTVKIAENVVGTEDYARVLPKINTSFTHRASGRAGNLGARTYNQYGVGYTAPHAAVVHETNIKYHQPPLSASNLQMPHPEHEKTSHFLLKAYENHRAYYTNAMIAGIQQTIDAIGTEALRREKIVSNRYQSPGLAVPGGARLVKK